MQRVQPGGGLVEEQHLGASDEARCQVEPAAHAAGVGAGAAPGGVGEPEAVDQLGGAGPGGCPRQIEQPADQVEVVAAGQGLVDGGVLAGEADQGADPGGVADDVAAEHRGPAGRRREQRGQHADGRRLAGAVGAEQAQDLSAPGGEGDPVDRADLTEGPDQAVDLDCGSVHAAERAPGR
ncbi:hypothetical protein XF36_21140 [Pseudonocardia sp. HH130629-09]|nr:hypothetical protein XF36_21140 [Pseudonocardia sp. HH130629-09]